VKEPSAKYLARPSTKQTDVGPIPEDWSVRRVGEMGDVRAGKALAVRAAGQQRPYLRTKNVFDGRIDLEDVLHMPMTDSEFGRYELRHGDVLLNEGQSLELVGRCAMYRGELSVPCAIQNQLVRFRAREGVSASFAAHLFRYCQKTGVFTKIALQTTSVAHLGVSRFEWLLLAWPSTLGEQQAIADALSDADALIESLERLLAKKRQLKQGAMQELLTGKKRLPGFKGEWKVTRLGQMLTICHGKSQRGLEATDGIYPILATGGEIGRANRFLYDKPSVLIGRKGTIDEPQYMDTPFWTVDTLFYSVVHEPNHAKFIFYRFCLIDWKQYNEASGVPSLNARTIEAIEISSPAADEQRAITDILSDMDVDIAGLGAKLAKARQIKQGMMQELLTGRTRLLTFGAVGEC